MKKRRKKKSKEDKVEYKKIWATVWPVLKKERKYFPILIIGGILLSCLTIAGPYIYGTLIDLMISFVADDVSPREGFQIITPILLVWLGIVILESIVNGVHAYTTWWVGNHAAGNYLRELFKRMLKQDVKLFESERTGNLIRRFDTAWAEIFQLTRIGVRDLSLGILLFIASLTIGFYLDWRMVLISLIPIPIVVGMGLMNFKWASKGQDKVNKEYERLSGFASDSFSNIATIKSFSREDVSDRIISKIFKGANDMQNKVNFSWAGVEAGYGAVYTGGRLLIFSTGTYFVIQGTLTVGTLIMFLGFISFIFSSVQRVVDSLPNILKAVTRLNRAQKLWHMVPEIMDGENAVILKRAKGLVEFDKVFFHYSPERKVLRSVSFSAKPGETIALIGESGAGKSSLAKMMLRYHDPIKGSIEIDGHDLRDLTLKSVRSNVGFVMQENLLFHDSILNNIKLAKPGAKKKDIIKAAKRAQAHDFIQKLPGGYNSTVGERGVKLSGGEKQRIALARVFLEDPPILVLDEATSALDSKTEHDLQAALAEVMKDRTTIVIAHRLSTVMSADKILVMDKGRIVDSGTHDELIKRDTLYKKFWQIQAGGYV